MADEESGKSIELKLKNVRGSFLNIFTPQEGRSESGKIQRANFNGNFLLAKDDPQVEMLREAMKKVILAAWPDKATRPKFADDRKCLRDGEPPDEDGVPTALYEGYAGCMYLSFNSPVKIDSEEALETYLADIKSGRKKRPLSIIGPKKGPDGKFRELQEGDEYAPYSGCYVNAVVQIYAYMGDKDKQQPPRINCSIEAVQFKAHGESFGRKRVDVNSAFDEEDDDDDIGVGAGGGSSSMDDDDEDDLGI